MFVASLAWMLWTFAAQWGRPVPFAPAGAARAVAIDMLLVAAFASHHSLFARETVKAALGRLVPARLLRSVYVWTASTLLLLVITSWQSVGGTLYERSGMPALAHAAVQLAGVLLIARAVRAIDALELAGIKQPALAASRVPGAESPALQVSGPYRLVRHPLYLGWMLLVFGAGVMTGDRLAFAILTSLYLVIAIQWEERSLTDAFGQAYTHYRQTVRWRVLPFIY